MGKKLLIVEDELHIRTLLEQALEDLEDEFDVEILSAADGEEGLEVIRRERPQAVFLDIMMPKKNGYEVCRAVKEDPELKDTIIVLLTAKGQEADRRKGLEIGAYDYMTKPFDPDEVVELAKELLQIVE
jgi:DNA-binding response OmpR family regulator